MICELKNPNTVDYLNLKEYILSTSFQWAWDDATTHGENDFPFLSHCVVRRPMETGYLYPVPESSLSPKFNYVIGQIIDYNNLDVNCILRINCNLTFPCGEGKKTPIHTDHPFPHKNLLIYLNDTDGDTICGDDAFSPKEDSIIMFEGEHYHYLPTQHKRVIIVITFV